MPQSPQRDIADGSLQQRWVAETIRLRESLWGSLEDSAEVRRARALGSSLGERAMLRARFLAQREGLDRILGRWRKGAGYALIAMLALAACAGAATAAAALGNGGQSVNLLLAVMAMLGIHTLTLLLWLASLALGRSQGGAWLGETWLWLTRRLARGPDAALAPMSLATLLERNGALRWLLGAISHGIWLMALVGLLAALLALLSVRSYTFHWETTVLSPDAFVGLTAILGWLPAQLGFHIPTDDIVRLSGRAPALAAAAAPAHIQAAWSGWLAGCVVVYGLLPRLLAFCLCMGMTRLRLRGALTQEERQTDPALAARLMPASERTGIDAPAQPDPIVPWSGASTTTADRQVIGIELSPDAPWPPAWMAADAGDLGMIDTRAQRNAVLEYLHRQPAAQLVLACDARQTPDRGVIALLAELAGLARQTHILLEDDNGAGRAALWRQKLTAAGFIETQIHDRPDTLPAAFLRQASASNDMPPVDAPSSPPADTASLA